MSPFLDLEGLLETQINSDTIATKCCVTAAIIYYSPYSSSATQNIILSPCVLLPLIMIGLMVVLLTLS